MWTAPRSFVKILFLGNRYITPVFQTIIVYEMSRLAVFSDTFCKWWITSSGFVEISSMAVADLLLLFRVHALWEGRRSVVIGTYAVYAFAYTCITIFGSITAFDVIPRLRYHPLARMCVFESRPKIMPAMWSISIVCELTVFVMTTIKAFEHHLRAFTESSSQNLVLRSTGILHCYHRPSLVQPSCLGYSTPVPLLPRPLLYLVINHSARFANHVAPSERSMCPFSTLRDELVWRDSCQEHSNRMGEAEQ